MCGSAYTLWDNIPLGLQISCPHIERACTSSFYSDRKLGETKTLTASAACVHLFTGNNVAPKGDLASRSLTARLDTDRADPENREFRHQDIRGWTAHNRGKIVAALLTLMLGNPALGLSRNAEMKTRFKLWQRLVGSAIEHAAALHNRDVCVDFAELFAAQDAADEESSTLADALAIIKRSLPPEFGANDVAALTQGQGPDNATVREFLFPNAAPGIALSPKSASKALGKYVGNPVKHASQTLTLRSRSGRGGTLKYFVAGLNAADNSPEYKPQATPAGRTDLRNVADRLKRRAERNPNCRDCGQPLVFDGSGPRRDMHIYCAPCRTKRKRSQDSRRVHARPRLAETDQREVTA
jgi:hypothetical protein